jgi:hypothetical protein
MSNRQNSQPSAGDTIDNPGEAKLTAHLVLQLINTASEVADQVRALQEQMQRSEEAQKEQATNLRCLAAGVKKFEAEYGPYLQRAVAAEKVWQERRNQVLVHMLKWGAIWALAIIVTPWERVLKVLWP